MAIALPEIDPVAFAVGPLRVHWYGLMYLGGFAFAWALALARSDRSWSPVRRHQVEDLIFFGALGVILGGRLGYVLFYGLDKWLADPLWVFRVWEGGMSFHGGLLGVVIALWLFARRIGQPLLAVGDFTAPLVPIGLGLGRIGNFVGQELWGRPTDVPWAVIFPRDPQHLPRHPSQLYEALLEGVVLFAVLYWVTRKPRPLGFASGLFLFLYGLFRFLVEFVREPDAHIGFDLFGWMSRGQLLSLPMVAAGALLVGWSLARGRKREQP
ncbi:MAG: prolipoprotein diacylglyceryl transferase [Porticoccaceae bacterium]|nr:MAG: prolipoprotein diacylglyceryl transferase [Porticoccaceae bacterium]